MGGPNNDLITAAVSAQPEQVEIALSRGADPFFVDQNGEFGYGALLRFAKLMQAPGASDSFSERIMGAIRTMNQMPFRPETAKNAESFALFLEEKASKSSHVNKITQDMAKVRGVAPDQVTTQYFQEAADTDTFLLNEFKASKIFAGVSSQMSDVDQWAFEQKAERARERGEGLAVQETALMDMQPDGRIMLRAQMTYHGQDNDNTNDPSNESGDVSAPKMTLGRLRQAVLAGRQDQTPADPRRGPGVK